VSIRAPAKSAADNQKERVSYILLSRARQVVLLHPTA